MTGVRELMRDRRFALLWLGQAVNTVGHGLTIVALATLLVETHGAGTLGLVLAADSAAMGADAAGRRRHRRPLFADRGHGRLRRRPLGGRARLRAGTGVVAHRPAALLRGARGLRRGAVPAGLAGGAAAGGAGRPAARGQRGRAADQPRRPAARRRTRRGPGGDGRTSARPAARRGDLPAQPDDPARPPAARCGRAGAGRPAGRAARGPRRASRWCSAGPGSPW